MALGALILLVLELGLLITFDQQNDKPVVLFQWLLLVLFVVAIAAGIFWLTVLGCCDCVS
jgi:hypothetical protein